MGGDTRSPAARARAVERERQVCELRLRGVAFHDIARQLVITPSGAYRAYCRALDKLAPREAELARTEQKERLDRMRAVLWTKAATAKGDAELAKLMGQLLRVEEREAKLLGLDCASKLSAHDAQEQAGRPSRREQSFADLARAMSNEDRITFLEILDRAGRALRESRQAGQRRSSANALQVEPAARRRV
jgi:hypothetical protein